MVIVAYLGKMSLGKETLGKWSMANPRFECNTAPIRRVDAAAFFSKGNSCKH